MKRPVKQVSKKGASCPQTVNFFSRFDPDPAAKTNFENTFLVHSIFRNTDQLFPLYLPILEKLWDKATAGCSEAAELLVKLAAHLCIRIALLEQQQPKLLSEIARKQNVWPVMADSQSVSSDEMLARFDALGLGKDIEHLDPRFHKAGGRDSDHPTRKWAKEAVRCVHDTRFMQTEVILREKIVEAQMAGGVWKRTDEPAWVSMTKNLPDFSQELTTRTKWEEVIRKMIRQQMPDFHLRSEWSNQRNACTKRGRGTKGVIQNKILEDIISALRTIAPRDVIPAGNPMPKFGE